MFIHRDYVAAAVAASLAIILLVLQSTLVLQHTILQSSPVYVKLITLPKPVPKAIPVPIPVPSVQPPPRLKPQAKARVVQVQSHPVAPPIASPVSVVATPSAQTAAAITNSLVHTTAPDANVQSMPSAASTITSPVEDVAGESSYTQAVHARIEDEKTYPNAAKQLGMEGSVEILYVIDRNGKLLTTEVVGSSGYPLLDRAALRAVQSATFKSMANTFWPGEAKKEFRTKVIFKLVD